MQIENFILSGLNNHHVIIMKCLISVSVKASLVRLSSWYISTPAVSLRCFQEPLHQGRVLNPLHFPRVLRVWYVLLILHPPVEAHLSASTSGGKVDSK